MPEYTQHQFGLFGYERPKLKVPIDAEKIRQAKALFKAGDIRNSAALIREVRESLAEFEKRLNNAVAAADNPKRKRTSGKFKANDEVMVEIEGHGKSEIVDATVISVTHRGVNLRTYWGKELRDHPPRLVRRC